QDRVRQLRRQRSQPERAAETRAMGRAVVRRNGQRDSRRAVRAQGRRARPAAGARGAAPRDDRARAGKGNAAAFPRAATRPRRRSMTSRRLARDEKLQLILYAALVLALHVIGWGWMWFRVAPRYPFMLGLAGL